MEIEEIPKRVVEFSDIRKEKGNYDLTEELSFAHLVEEVGELSKEMFSKKARPEKYSEINLKKQVCDIIIESMILADILKMNLSDELNKKLDELNTRGL